MIPKPTVIVRMGEGVRLESFDVVHNASNRVSRSALVYSLENQEK